ncbi:MAG TPA: hypothetical protein VII56_19345 [Rhizomicrobium sp.]
MSTALNIAMLLVIASAVMGGTALFWIARQDDSRAGRLLGLLIVALGAAAVLWLGAGGHWF